MKYSIIFLLFFTEIQAYSKTLKTDGRNGNKIEAVDSINFKFKLHKLERKLISIQLNVKDEQIPLKISINARKRMAIWYKAGNKLLMRGKPQFVKFLDAKNKDNELTISINDKNWVILINGNDISTKFGNTLEHNSQYKSVLEIKAIAPDPIRRLTISQNGENPDWSKLNYKYCGLGYKLNKIQLRSVPPSILQSYNSYSESYLDKCALTRDAFLTGTPVPQSAAVKHGDSVKMVPGQNPWLVSLSIPNSPQVHRCGGSLINKCWIITAAHCFDTIPLQTRGIVKVGDFHNRQSWKEVESYHETKIKQVIKHPLWDALTMKNDIAMVQMNDCLENFSQFASPICLPTSTSAFGKGDCCTTGGWGKTADNQTQLEEFIKKEQAYKQLNRRYTPFYTTQTALFPTIPRMTFNFIQENQVCYKQYDSQYDPQGQFCGTHQLQSGIIADSCQADSGGPLQCETPLAEENRKSEIKNAVAKEKRYTLWGITSYGGNSQGLCSDAAGTNHNAGMYTKVVNYMDWIKLQFTIHRINSNE